ncbi:MAG: hypothetical protein COB49_06865 [Alphaproteobacteria bacterium]|nr:MAG: hypothetical protein COB49_06865 [Alphaproteobacteria bacterium]
MRKKWSQAIKYGERMLVGASALYPESDLGYINRLKTLNRYYDKAGRLLEVHDRITKAYRLTTKYIDPDHYSSKICRLLYYKLMIAEKKYARAIPPVQEYISLLGRNKGEMFKKLHYLTQLYSLYGLTDQFVKQEDILLKFITLNNQLLGQDDENTTKALVLLAKNYCRQGKHDQFKALQRKYNLPYTCK